jgi:GH25 family lysozyme M1 (1,4-beta-N-acetylmuramidase)
MTQYQDAYAGEFYQDRPNYNINTLINAVYTKPAKFVPSAQITRVVQFPDVSFYQGEINYSIMCMQTEAIILRAGQNLWDDDQFERNYLEARKCNKKIGVYWFYDDRIDPARQAVTLVNLLLGKTFEMEVFIDWENSYGGQFGSLQNVVAMMQLVEDAINKGVVIAKDVGMYTGYYWFRGHSNAVANAGQYNYLKNKPLWLAWYTNNPEDVLIPAPWTHLTIWQFGTPVVDWGQETREIDMNFFNGTRQEFEDHYGEVIGEPPMADHVILKSNTTANRTIRRPTSYPTIPHIMGGFLSSLLAGDELITEPTSFYEYTSPVRYTPPGSTSIYEAFAGDKWWKIKVVVSGAEQEGWIAEIHKGVRYLDVEVVQDTPTPTNILEVYVNGNLEYRKEF